MNNNVSTGGVKSSKEGSKPRQKVKFEGENDEEKTEGSEERGVKGWLYGDYKVGGINFAIARVTEDRQVKTRTPANQTTDKKETKKLLPGDAAVEVPGEGGGGRRGDGLGDGGGRYQGGCKTECDIRENFDTNECPNIFVSTKLHE